MSKRKNQMDEEFLNQRRQHSNRELLGLLSEQIEKYPSQRFSQILRNAGFVHQYECAGGVVWKDEFNLEPWKLQKRVESEIQKLGFRGCQS